MNKTYLVEYETHRNKGFTNKVFCETLEQAERLQKELLLLKHVSVALVVVVDV